MGTGSKGNLNLKPVKDVPRGKFFFGAMPAGKVLWQYFIGATQQEETHDNISLAVRQQRRVSSWQK
jgi:hypothetical protein